MTPNQLFHIWYLMCIHPRSAIRQLLKGPPSRVGTTLAATLAFTFALLLPDCVYQYSYIQRCIQYSYTPRECYESGLVVPHVGLWMFLSWITFRLFARLVIWNVENHTANTTSPFSVKVAVGWAFAPSIFASILAFSYLLYNRNVPWWPSSISLPAIPPIPRTTFAIEITGTLYALIVASINLSEVAEISIVTGLLIIFGNFALTLMIMFVPYLLLLAAMSPEL